MNMYFKSSIVVIAAIFLLCSQFGKKSILVTAHRGASGLAPENTISALKTAIDLDAEYSEIDVQETRDGIVVLLHDSTLKKVAGIDKAIWELDYADIRNNDVGSWFDAKFKGESIPTLEEVIDVVKGEMKLNIELKNYGLQKQLAERVLAIIEKKDFYSNCIITSFDFSLINKIRKLNNNVKVGYIFSEMPIEVDVFSADVDLLSVNHKIVDKEFVKTAHTNNKDVHVYTVNEPEEMKRLIKIRVKSIITDRPDILLNVLNLTE